MPRPHDILSEPTPAHVQSSWLHNFLVNTHLSAPNRRMGAGLGIYGAAIEPRLEMGSVRTQNNVTEKGNSLA